MARVKDWLGRGLGAAGVGLVAWQLLAGAPAAAEGVRRSLAVCGELLIPSLFPFMVLAALLPGTAAGRLLAAPLRPVARWLYRLPPTLAPALLMSWIGGYPAGARALGELVDRGELTPQEAGLALCACVNTGPAFMVTVVGGTLLGSPAVGLKLFGYQLVAGVFTARLLGVRVREHPGCAGQTDRPLAELLVGAVTSAASAMVSVCAFVLLLGAVTALGQSSGLLPAVAGAMERVTGGLLTAQAAGVLLSGALEICGGCAQAAALTPAQTLPVLAFLLSFGGVAVICQVMAALGGRGVPMGRFLLSRPLHGALTLLLAWPLLYNDCRIIAAFAPLRPAMAGGARTIPAVALLLAVCAMLCLVVEDGTDKVV